MKETARIEWDERVAAWEDTVEREAGSADRRASEPVAGLCSTCNHFPGCGYRGGSAGPVVFCEEFDIREGGESGGGDRGPRALWAVRSGESPLGLCSNCDHRRSCTFPRPEGGIWHCEEYA